ncbi:MAG: toll/interleukin-1 receptor domain-containing protein [Bacteroidota bacterium]
MMKKDNSVHIILRRNTYLFGAAIPISIRIDGEKKGYIWSGQEKSIFVNPGEKFIQIKMFKGIFGVDSKTIKSSKLYYGQKLILECGIRNGIGLFLEQNEPIVSSFEDGIFLSYRRADSELITGRIYDKLVSQFGEESVFKDNYSIDLGDNFKREIENTLRSCKVFLPVIGKNWHKRGKKNLFDNPRDFVKLETTIAIENELTILPIFVNSGKMPDQQDLPTEIKDIVYYNGAIVRNDPDFHSDFEVVLDKIKTVLTAK